MIDTCLLDKRKVLLGLGKVDFAFWEHCIMRKHHRRAFTVGTHNFTEILEYVHSDVWGPSSTASFS